MSLHVLDHLFDKRWIEQLGVRIEKKHIIGAVVEGVIYASVVAAGVAEIAPGLNECEIGEIPADHIFGAISRTIVDDDD